jgi:hypothetical protein
MDETLLERIFRALHREKVRYAVFGGVALNLHGIVRTTPPTGPFHVDILTRLGEAFTFEDLETMETGFKGVPVPVVTPRMLHRMKRDTVRPKDRGDAEELRRRFGLGEKD